MSETHKLESIYREDCLNAGVQDAYDNLIRQGHNPGFAAMLALRSPPAYTGSDRAFLEGDMGNHGFHHEPEWFRDMMIAEAKAAGVQTQGKVYKSSLADQRGPADPRAWVSGRDDVLAVCKERNLICRGSVNHQGYVPPPTPDVELSEELIQESIPDFQKEMPKASLPEIREAILDKHSVRATKKPHKREHEPGGGPAG